MAYIKKKTQREINVENMSDEFPVVRRFFVAVFFIVALENLHGFKTFCDRHGIDSRNLDRLIKDPSRRLDTNFLVILVKQYGFSAHWLLTGEGPMRQNLDK